METINGFGKRGKTEDGRRKTGDGRPKTEDRRPETEARRPKNVTWPASGAWRWKDEEGELGSMT